MLRAFITNAGFIIGQAGDETDEIITLIEPIKLFKMDQNSLGASSLFTDELEAYIPKKTFIEVKVTKKLESVYEDGRRQLNSTLELPAKKGLIL